MTAKSKKKLSDSTALPAKTSELLDVKGAAALLTVSVDTVYEYFQKGKLPGCKVGRKWITTKAAVLRWVERSITDDSLARALERGDHNALTAALNSGKVRISA